jgi:hypothetical protein
MEVRPVETSCSMWTDRYDEDNIRFSQFCDVTKMETTKKWAFLSALFNDDVSF